ncbi:MAG TPA: PH domain-containing protein [Pseudonocardiaceae bacterium]|jgi:putative membrane protein|nr:PH domain-containing protein [Pseudonocardiaceae bacterium]
MSDLTTASQVDAGSAPVAVDTDGWRRLEIRTILVRPFNEILSFVPLLIGVVALGQHGGQRLYWGLGIIALLLGRGLLHYLTTKYRITDEQVELHTGLVFRQRFATRRSRIRTVESTAKFGHRLFGVTAVRIGTGQHEQKNSKTMKLDAVTNAEADRLRRELLRRTAWTDGAVADRRPPAEVIERLDWAWLRYAPLTLSGLFAIVAVAGLAWRVISELDISVNRIALARDGVHWFEHTSLGMVIFVVAVIGLLIIVFGSMVVYALKFNGYQLTREADDTLHVRRGLLTTQAVTIEEARLRGVEIREPMLLRAGKGARCSAVATGLQHKSESHLLMPPGPAVEAHRVAAEVLRAKDGSPTVAALVRHPAKALRRRLFRAVLPSLLLVLALWLAHEWGGWPTWLWVASCAVPVLAVPVAVNRYRNLGHALTPRYLVSRSGSFDRRTVALQRDGIIGWKVRSSFFQRRVGLTSLTATIAAGRGAYHVLDMTDSDAVRLAEEAVPGLLAPFMVKDAQ